MHEVGSSRKSAQYAALKRQMVGARKVGGLCVYLKHKRHGYGRQVGRKTVTVGHPGKVAKKTAGEVRRRGDVMNLYDATSPRRCDGNRQLRLISGSSLAVDTIQCTLKC